MQRVAKQNIYLSARKAILVVCGTYVASRSIMLKRSCLLLNIEVFYINLLVLPCDCRRKCTATMPLLVYVSFYKNICKKGRDQCIFANSFA